MKSIQNTKERDLERGEELLKQMKPNMELEIFDEPRVAALKEAMELFEKWEVKAKMAEVYGYWAAYHSNQEDLEKVFDYLQKSLAIRKTLYGEVHETIAELHRCFGMYYRDVFNMPLALKHAQKALQMNLDLFGEYHVASIKSYYSLGNVYKRDECFNEALDCLTKALDNSLKVSKIDDLLSGDLQRDIGDIYYSIGNLIQSKIHLQKSLDIYQKILPSTHKRFFGNYYLLSLILKNEGDYNKAMLFLQKSATGFELLHPGCIELAYVYHEMANIYIKTIDHENALEREQKALNVLTASNKNRHPIVPYVLSNLGMIYNHLNNTLQALDYLQKALSVTIDIYSNQHQMLGRIYREIGSVHRDIGGRDNSMDDLEQAIEYYQKALDIFEKNESARLIELLAVWREMSVTLLKSKKYLSALHYSQKVVTTLLGCPEVEDIYEYIPFVSHKENYQIPLNQDFFLGTVSLKAYIFFQYYLNESKDLKHLQAALTNFELLLNYSDLMFQSFYSNQAKLLVVKNLEPDIEDSISIAYIFFEETSKEDYLQSAFKFSEKNKAYLMLENSQEKIAQLQTELPADILQLEKELKKKLIVLEKKIQNEQQKKNTSNKHPLQEHQKKYFIAYNEFEALKKQLETDYPDYYLQKYSAKTVTIEALQKKLEVHQTVLSYFIGEKKIYLFAITTDEYEVFAMDKPDNWASLIQSYLQSIKFHQKEKFQELSFELYQFLLQEAIDYLIDSFEDETRQVFIIPHAELHYRPFETLLISEANPSIPYSELDYLLNYCEISYHYSATLLHLDLQKQEMHAERTPTDITFTGFAPVYDITSNEQKQALEVMQKEYATEVNRSEAIRGDGTWMPLPYSKLEVEGISQLFEQEGLKSNVFLYKSANKSNLEEQIGKSRFVLIAAHGIVNDEYPELSGLVLASGGDTLVINERKGNSPLFEKHNDIWNDDEKEQRSSEQTAIEDCILNMKEVAMIPMSADLVVLSSCESGIGELHKGEGMMAVNRGFLASGAKNVVSTLFKVNDKASSELTTLLFQYILEGENYGTALQKAKLDLLKKTGMSPKAWSGFVLFGKGR